MSHRLKEIAPVIITSMSNFSIGEIATIFTGYTESHVVVPKLSKAVIRSFALKCFLLGCFMMQIERVDTQNALSLVYSYSRSFKHQQNRSFERSAVDSLFDVIFQNPSEYSFLSIIPNRLSVSNSVFLLSSFINFNYFPAGKVDIVLSKVLPQNRFAFGRPMLRCSLYTVKDTVILTSRCDR